MDYKSSGVDIHAGYRSNELIKSIAGATYTRDVLGGIGGFGAFYSIADCKTMKNPVLVSGTDGVGTKLAVAFMMDRHDSIGMDCVAMCANDVACSGARPLFFLDYIACGKNYPEKTAQIVSGVADACRDIGCALIGGETAEHPGLMPEDEYDLAGFCVGIAEKDEMICGRGLKAGDVIIGLPSSGVHSNGFSLIRKVFDVKKDCLYQYHEELGKTLGEELLTPTRLYCNELAALKNAGIRVKACAHITGGGFYENIPRMLKKHTRAKIEKAAIQAPVIFDLIRKAGDIAEEEMYSTFNMGLGMCLCVGAKKADRALAALNLTGAQAFVIGKIVDGQAGVDLV